MRKHVRLAFTAALLASASGAFAGGARAEDTADQAAIRKVISGTWGTAEAPVSIDPVVTQGDHAVAGWTWGERGGRALLSRKKDTWVVELCSGDGLKESELLKQAGVPPEQADRLAASVAEAERKQPSARVKQFGTFEGVMDMRAAQKDTPATK